MKEAIIEVIKWIKESIRPVFVLFVLSALVLFLPSNWIAALGGTGAFQRYRFVAFLGFVGSFVWLATFPIEKRYRLRQRKLYLNRLALDEKNVLAGYIARKETISCFGWRTIGVAKNLAKSGILFDTGAVDGRNDPYFAMDNWTFAYLCEHPELVGLSKKSDL